MEKLRGSYDEIEDLRSKISFLTQERDSAMEMWKLAELVATNAKDEIRAQSSSSKFDSMKKDMETMQQDYSDAIKLLEYKVKALEKEIQISRDKNIAASDEILLLKTKNSQMEDELNRLQFNAKRYKAEKDDAENSLKECQKKLDEAANVASQAREKVKDALNMAQDALTNETTLLEEKENLEKRITALVEESENRLDREISDVKSCLNTRIESLSNQLQVTAAGKNKLSLECERIKSEYNLRHQEISLKYTSLNEEIQDIRSRRQSEINQWSEERDTLRKHISSLQAELEVALLELRQKENADCTNCSEMKMHLEKYRFLAKEWEEAAYSVTKEFEKYSSEVKKFKTGQTCQ